MLPVLPMQQVLPVLPGSMSRPREWNSAHPEGPKEHSAQKTKAPQHYKKESNETHQSYSQVYLLFESLII